MSKVIIVVNAQVDNGKISPSAPVAQKMAEALKHSIIESYPCHEVKIIGGADLWSKSGQLQSLDSDTIYCPLTIKLPDWFHFPGQMVYSACRDLEKRRKWVQQHFGYKTSFDNSLLGDLWLPIIVSDDGITYGSIIGEGVIPNYYQQPYLISPDIYPSLQNLAEGLLQSIHGIPSVYLLQFKIRENKIIFDRLWPFPATPAIASINGEKPNLFDYHWQCLKNARVNDLKISYS